MNWAETRTMLLNAGIQSLPEEWEPGIDLRGADLHRADLREADLHRADLRWANLCGADLWGADLHEADLHRANLHRANLCGADLHRADLREADLRGADLDFASWPLWCGSLGARIDEQQARQLAYHLAAALPDDINSKWVEGLQEFANGWDGIARHDLVSYHVGAGSGGRKERDDD